MQPLATALNQILKREEEKKKEKKTEDENVKTTCKLKLLSSSKWAT